MPSESVSTPTVCADVGQRGQENKIARRGAEHDVAGVQERIGHEVQELVAAGRYDNLLQRRRRAAVRRAISGSHAGDNRLAQVVRAQSWCRIAKRPGACGLRPQRGQGLLGRLDRQCCLIDETGCQGDEVRPCQGLGHQAADQFVAARPMSPATQTELFICCHIRSTEFIPSAESLVLHDGTLGKQGF